MIREEVVSSNVSVRQEIAQTDIDIRYWEAFTLQGLRVRVEGELTQLLWLGRYVGEPYDMRVSRTVLKGRKL